MCLKFLFDSTSETITICLNNGEERNISLGDPEAFQILSSAWLRSGWDTKYVYGFSWLGRPIIQLPEDLLRIQEVIYTIQPDVIIETGIAHGGSLVFYASLCKLMGRGRVIGIDIEIRPHNRTALETHSLYSYLTLLEGSSTDPDVINAVHSQVQPGETVLVLLDSDHSQAHVVAELEAYAPLVSSGSYIVACDGIMQQVAGAPRTQPDWSWNNPLSAIVEFLNNHPEFEVSEPAWPFNEGFVKERVTYWPQAFLRRK